MKFKADWRRLRVIGLRVLCLLLLVSPSLTFTFFPIVSVSPLLALTLGPSVASTAAAYVTFKDLEWFIFLYAATMRMVRVWAGLRIIREVQSRKQEIALVSLRPMRRASTLSLMLFPTAWTSIAAKLCDVPVVQIYAVSFVSIVVSQAIWVLTLQQAPDIVGLLYRAITENGMISIPITVVLGSVLWWRHLRIKTLSIAKGLFD